MIQLKKKIIFTLFKLIGHSNYLLVMGAAKVSRLNGKKISITYAFIF